MIIYIEDTQIFLDNDTQRHAIENILLSHYNGNCLAFTKSRRLMKEVVSNHLISDRAKKAAYDLLETMAYSLKIVEGSVLYFKTSGIGDENPKSSEYGWHANISFFESPELLSQCKFVAESLRDIDLYEHSAVHYLVKSGLHRDIKIRFDAKPGGGGSTADLLNRCIQTGKTPTLCVVDSDKTSSTSSIGKTARDAQSIDLNLKSNCLYILPVRAAENTVPKEVLANVFSKHKSFIDFHFFDQKYLPFGFANLKHQNSFKEILEITEDGVIDDWIDWIARKLPNHVDRDCIDNRSCKSQVCECYLTPSFSDYCLHKVVQYFGMNASQKTAKESNDSIMNVWNEVGRLVASYFACAKSIRTS